MATLESNSRCNSGLSHIFLIMNTETICHGVREYGEGYPVKIATTEGEWADAPKEQWRGHGRLVVSAENEGGYNGTEVDLLELLACVKREMPEVWASIP